MELKAIAQLIGAIKDSDSCKKEVVQSERREVMRIEEITGEKKYNRTNDGNGAIKISF